MDLYRFRLYNVSFLKSGDFERHLEKDFFVKKKRKKKLSLGALLFQISPPSPLLPKRLGTKIEPRWHAGHGHLPRDKARESNRIRINQPGNPLLTIRRLLDTYLHDFLWKQSLSQDFWRGPFAGRLISRLAMIFLSLSLSSNRRNSHSLRAFRPVEERAVVYQPGVGVHPADNKLFN